MSRLALIATAARHAVETPEIAGWYGKLPSLGDFASRRLPPPFVDDWDEWLASGLADWRAREPERWLDSYLAGPSWRFLLMPGVLPSGAWAGVLMPSVDRVGRYFPFTLALRLAALPGSVTQTQALLNRLQHLDDIALAALQDDWSVEQLEAALQQMKPWQAASTLVPPASGQPPDPLAEWLARSASGPHSAALQGRALWITRDGGGGHVLRTTRGLPRAAAFSELLTDAGPSLESDDTLKETR